MFGNPKPEIIKGLIEKVLKEADIPYSDIKVTTAMTTSHHHDTALSVTFKDVVSSWNGSKGDRMGSIYFKGLPTGCGLALMHGFAFFADFEDKMLPVVKRMVEYYHNEGCAIIASIGGEKWENCPFLTNLGFTKISEYWNMAHSHNNDKQSVWISHAKSIIRESDGSIKNRIGV